MGSRKSTDNNCICFYRIQIRLSSCITFVLRNLLLLLWALKSSLLWLRLLPPISCLSYSSVYPCDAVRILITFSIKNMDHHRRWSTYFNFYSTNRNLLNVIFRKELILCSRTNLLKMHHLLQKEYIASSSFNESMWLSKLERLSLRIWMHNGTCHAFKTTLW